MSRNRLRRIRHTFCILFVAIFLLSVQNLFAQSEQPDGEQVGNSSSPDSTDPAAPSSGLSHGRILWNGLDRALQLAGESEKIILIFVYDPNCSFCRQMDRDVFPDRAVSEMINRYMIPVQINVNSLSTVRYFNRTFSQSEFAEALDNEQVPTTYFMNGEGAVVGQQPGYIEPELYALLIEFVGSGAFERQSFDQFRSGR